MTERDLGTLLERASEHLPEVDFAHGAWSAAVAERARRRRLAVGALGAVAAAGLAVTAVQLGGTTKPRPTPAVSSTTTASPKTLSDGTAYALMPLEGKEAQLPDFDAGLPSVIDVRAQAAHSFAGPPTSVVAVYLRVDGDVFHPVLVARDGTQTIVDKLDLVSTDEANGNAATPLGPRAIGGGGRYIVFPQRDHVVRLDTQSGDIVSYPVPSRVVEWAGWNASGSAIVARDADQQAWVIDPSKRGATAVQVVGGYEGKFRITSVDMNSIGLMVTTFDAATRTVGETTVRAPVDSVFGETINTEKLAATGAFFDQTITAEVISRGNGPIYQGLVAVDVDTRKAQVLLAPENPDGQTGRFKGCCTVLGWAGTKTLLYQSVGSHGRWILAWDVTTGAVYEVSRLVTGAPDDPPSPIALNVGRRY